MIKVGILGDIGSGKSFVARQFGYPVFNADNEVAKLYKKSRKCYKKLKKVLPKYITSFPVSKKEISKAIMENQNNLNKVNKIVHSEVRMSMKKFLKKNKNKKIIVLDVPLLIENKIDEKKYTLVFVYAKKKEISKRLKKRPNYNAKVIKKFKKLQLPLEIKRKKSDFIIKNNFNNFFVKKNVKKVVKKILLNA